MKFFNTLNELESYRVKMSFDRVLGFILEDKPEYIMNPYKYERKQDITHNVSDYIENINKKIHGEKLFKRVEEIISDCDDNFEQLCFDF